MKCQWMFAMLMASTLVIPATAQDVNQPLPPADSAIATAPFDTSGNSPMLSGNSQPSAAPEDILDEYEQHMAVEPRSRTPHFSQADFRIVSARDARAHDLSRSLSPFAGFGGRC